ncbi:MAG: PAS domain S-box protein [Thermodesulforhabdaceae bacterium]
MIFSDNDQKGRGIKFEEVQIPGIEGSVLDLNTILKEAGLTVIVTYLSGKIIHVFGNFEEIFGKTSEEIIATGSIQNLLGDLIIDLENLPLLKDEIRNIEREIKDVFGRSRLLMIYVKKVNTGGEKLIYTIGDYTELKENENRLNLTLEELSAIYTHAPIAIMVLDNYRRIVSANDLSAEISGREKRDIIGISIGEAISCIHQLDNKEGCGFGKFCSECKINVAISETFKNQRGQKNIDAWVYFEKSGEKKGKCLSLSTAYIKYFDKNLVLICFQDVTEQKKSSFEFQSAGDFVLLKRKDLNELLDISALIHQDLGFDVVAKKIFDVLKNLIGSSSGYVGLFNKEIDGFDIVYLDYGGFECLVDPNIPMPLRGLRAEAYKSGKFVIENDFENSKWMDLIPKGHLRLKNVLFAPMKIEGKIVGLLGFGNKEGGFTQIDGELAQLFGNWAAIALKNAMEAEKRNITEKALRLSEQRYRELFDNPFTGIAVYEAVDDGSDFVFLDFNKAAERMTHTSKDQVLGKRVTSAFPGIKEMGLLRIFQEVYKTGQPQVYPTSAYVFEEGAVRYYENYVYKLPSGEIVAIFIDEMKRKNAENALINEHEELLALFDAIDQVIYVSDPYTHEILFVNRYFRELLGRDVVGELCYKAFQGMDRPCEFCTNDMILRERPKPYTWEYRNPILGRDYWITDRIIQWPDGRAVRFEIAVDITERKKAEVMLQEAEEKYRLFFENVNDILYSVDREFRIVDITPSVKNILGYAPQELIGKTIQELNILDSRYIEEVLSDINVAFQGKIIPIKEYPLLTKDGTLKYLEVGRAPLYKDNQIVNVLCIARDVTARRMAEEEKKNLEAQLQHAQKMESIGRLAGGIAHDFNNMLGVILGYGELILNGLKDTDPLKKHVEMIVEAAKKSAGLTQQLLAFSRKQPLRPKVKNLNNVIMNMHDIIKRLIGEDIELILDLSHEIGHVLIDQAQMEQVIMNLVVNARDAMPKGGRLLIETMEIFLDDNYARSHHQVKPGQYIMMALSDTGCGIPPEIMDKIFDPFFTTREKGRGTGLGLSMVYGIVKQFNGHIWVYSEPGKGSTFKIYLIYS